MSERERGEGQATPRGVEGVDAADGAAGASASPDLAWLEARERGDRVLPAIDPQRAAAYESLFALVGQLPDEPPPTTWNDEVLTRIRAEKAQRAADTAATAGTSDRDQARSAPRRAAPPRRRIPPFSARTGALAGAFAVAAALLLWLILRKPPTPAPVENGLTIAVLHQEGMRSDPVEGEAALGDVLTARIISTAADEVRIYRDDRELVVRCPVAGDARCKLAGRHHVIELPLDAPGSYRAVALRPAPTKPPSGDLQADLKDCDCNPITAVPVIVR